MTSQKLMNFPSKLADFCHARRMQPYAWGTNDCVTFAADGVLAITGNDPITELRGTWSDAETAAAKIEEMGGLINAVDARFKRRENKNLAQRGDLVMMRLASGPSLAICVGMYAAAPGDEHMLLVPMAHASLVWEV